MVGKFIDGLFLISIWAVFGLILSVANVLVSSHIPFFVPGVILSASGAIFHLIVRAMKMKISWWLSGALISVLSMTVTLLLIQDSKEWFITKMLLVYYLFFSTFLYRVCDKLMR